MAASPGDLVTTWQLFVDESGAGWRGEERFLLGGVLVPHRPTTSFRTDLERRLRAASPGLPWPIHAQRLAIPAARLEAVRLGADGCSAVARSLAERIADLAEPAVQAWARSLEGRKESELPALLELDLWLRRSHPGDHAALTGEARRVETALLAELAAVRGAVAVASVDPPASDGPRARYLRVFQGLLERVALVVDPRDRVLVRSARYPEVDRVDLAAAIRDLVPQVRRPAFLEATAPERWADGLHPGLVLADLVANRLRRATSGDWERVVRRIERTLRIPVVAATPHGSALPTLAAEGSPRRAVSLRLSGAPADRAVSEIDRAAVQGWAREQAEAWIRALGEAA